MTNSFPTGCFACSLTLIGPQDLVTAKCGPIEVSRRLRTFFPKVILTVAVSFHRFFRQGRQESHSPRWLYIHSTVNAELLGGRKGCVATNHQILAHFRYETSTYRMRHQT